MLGTMESGDRIVIADMEAGAGVLTRMEEGALDLALLVTNPTPKSIEVARRATAIIIERKVGALLLVANKVRDDGDLQLIRDAVGDAEIFVIPDDESVNRADVEGVSPMDLDPGSPAVLAIARLAERITAR
ncbi:MAG: hypothetical protein NVSMB17_06700 [Candidatus Dormibacteria bacterium]